MQPITPIEPLLARLDELRALIDGLDDRTYAAPAPGQHAGGGIGGHIRHCLDHVSALLTATRTGLCRYDRRRRGTDVETSREAARRLIDRLSQDLRSLEPTSLDRPVRVETQLDANEAMYETASSIGREVIFVMSHTIHHDAILGQLLSAHGVELPARFGVAASTPATVAPEAVPAPSCAR